MDELFDPFSEDTWDAGFEGGRTVVVSRLGPFVRVFERPPEFHRHFWHNVHELSIRDWEIVLTPLRFGQLCRVQATLHIRYQPTLRYAREHSEFLPELSAQVERSMEALLKDIAEQELRRMESDSSWLETGCGAIEKAVAAIVDEVLVLRGVHCRTRCHIEPQFAAVDSVDLDTLPPWAYQQAIYEEFLRRRREAKQRILKEQTEEATVARRLLMEREALLLTLAKEEEEQAKARQQHELERLQKELAAVEERAKEQLDSETRQREEAIQHQALLQQMQIAAELKAKEAELEKQRAEIAAETLRLAERRAIETRWQEKQLEHEALLRQQRTEAELKALEDDLKVRQVELANKAALQTEQQNHELRQREDQLIHEGWLKQMQAEAEVKAKETALQTRLLAEQTLLAKQQESEARQREEQLRHEAYIQQLQITAEIQAKTMALEKMKQEMSKTEAELAQQREYEVRQHQQQLIHNAQLRQVQTELELKEKELRAPEIAELESHLNREIGILAMERQRLRLEEEIRETKLARTRNVISRARKTLPAGQEQNGADGAA